MTFRELQKLISNRYNLDAATASETASDLINDELLKFKTMNTEEVNKALTLLETKAIA